MEGTNIAAQIVVARVSALMEGVSVNAQIVVTRQFAFMEDGNTSVPSVME